MIIKRLMIVMFAAIMHVHAADEQNQRDVQLFDALKYGESLETIQGLVKEGARVEAIKKQTLVGYGALHYVVLRGNVEDKKELALYLIEECRIDVDDRDSNGSTPCQLAAGCNKTDWIEMLVKKGADVNAKNYKGSRPLHFATYQNSSKATEALLKYEKIDVNAKDESGATPLHCACRCNAQKVVELLLQCGASVQEKNVWGETPLDLARTYGSDDIVKCLEDWENFSDIKEPEDN